MKTVLHLERRFCDPNETFIANQINSIQEFKCIVGTIVHTHALPCTKEIIVPSDKSFLSHFTKYLTYRSASKFYDELSRYQVDLIHTHYLVDAIFFQKLTSRFSVPKICSGYGYDTSSFPTRYFGIAKHFYPPVFREYRKFLAMSEDMKHDLLSLGCPEIKIQLHYFGIDVSRFLNTTRSYDRPGRKCIILSVGTFEEKKAQHLVIRALAMLQGKYQNDNYEYHLVGSGEYEKVIRAEALRSGILDKIVFHGYVPYYDQRFPALYNSADIFILPSMTLKNNDKEGIPGVIVEAMASGLPVVSTFHAGIPSIVRNNREGLLVQERDIEGLAEALHRLMIQPELRKSLGTNARQKAIEELDLNIGTKRLENIYDDILTMQN